MKVFIAIDWEENNIIGAYKSYDEAVSAIKSKYEDYLLEVWDELDSTDQDEYDGFNDFVEFYIQEGYPFCVEMYSI